MTAIIIEQVGNGFIVKPYRNGEAVENEEIKVFTRFGSVINNQGESLTTYLHSCFKVSARKRRKKAELVWPMEGEQ